MTKKCKPKKRKHKHAIMYLPRDKNSYLCFGKYSSIFFLLHEHMFKTYVIYNVDVKPQKVTLKASIIL